MVKQKDKFYSKLLSTPHGALGTKGNQDRQGCRFELSTPHGALGTR